MVKIDKSKSGIIGSNFNWSPDGKYIAYSCSFNSRLTGIKIYDVKRDDSAFKNFFKTKQDPRDFQELRTSLKRLGFNNHKIVGDLGIAAKTKLELFGFRL